VSGGPTPEASAGASARPFARVAAAWLPALSYMALIWWLSSMPITLPLASIPWRDKAAHLFEYGLLGLLDARAVRRTWPGLLPGRAWAGAAVLTASWGYLDEIHQAFVPGRNASAYDLLADVVGAGVGVVAYAVIARMRRR
jgi:VanZ family protein